MYTSAIIPIQSVVQSGDAPRRHIALVQSGATDDGSSVSWLRTISFYF
jgi:hypothetical protein